MAYSETPSDTLPLHQAVNANNVALLRQLLSDESTELNKKDDSGRTALTLALWLEHFRIAGMLLDVGAELSSKSPAQGGLADIDFAHRPELAPYFRTRLLQNAVLRLPDGITKDQAEKRLDNFAAGLKRIPSIIWYWGCSFCKGVDEHVNNDESIFVRTWAYRTGKKVFYDIDGRLQRFWKPEFCLFGRCKDMSVTIRAKLTVPACGNPQTFPEFPCFPKLKIPQPTSKASELYVEQGSFSASVGDDPLIKDRNNGPITINLLPSTTSDNTWRFIGIELDLGPETELEAIIKKSHGPPPVTGLELPQRMAIYAQLYRWYDHEQELANHPNRENLLEYKTLLTARELASLRFKYSPHRLVLMTQLRQRTVDILSIDTATVALRRLVVASSDLSPDHLRVLIRLVEDLLAQNSRGRPKAFLPHTCPGRPAPSLCVR